VVSSSGCCWVALLDLVRLGFAVCSVPKLAVVRASGFAHLEVKCGHVLVLSLAPLMSLPPGNFMNSGLFPQGRVHWRTERNHNDSPSFDGGRCRRTNKACGTSVLEPDVSPASEHTHGCLQEEGWPGPSQVIYGKVHFLNALPFLPRSGVFRSSFTFICHIDLYYSLDHAGRPHLTFNHSRIVLLFEPLKGFYIAE